MVLAGENGDVAIPRTLSFGLRVGRALREARAGHALPVQALAAETATAADDTVRLLFRGKVTDVGRRAEDSFTKGHAVLSAFRPGGRLADRLDLDFQNEHLVAVVDG